MSSSSDSSETLTILHVEDSDNDAKLVDRALERETLYDCALSRVLDIEAGLAFINSNKVDLLLFSVATPDSRCLENLRSIRTFSPQTAIVIISEMEDEQFATQAMINGVQDILIRSELKPKFIARAIRYAIERHKHDQQIIDLANTDMLTGLANKARFIDYLEQAINSVQRFHYSLSILFIDCDHFKLINDTYGHAKGDEFLIALSKILSSVLRASDFAARLSGDEFAIALQTKSNTLRSPLVVAEKILNSIREGISLTLGENMDARCSIGITSYCGRDPATSPQKLLNEADTAMYLSKKRGGDCASFFDQKLEKQAARRISLSSDMAHAFREGEFYLNYQPIINAKTQDFCGLETLLRWKNRRGETIAPSEFIPLLEENGYIQTIGNWIIKQACLDYLTLIEHELLDSSAWLSVNVSSLQLQAKHFYTKLEATVINSGINPETLRLEINETLLADKSENVLTVLNQVRELGCKWTIDDFGIGSCSISYLKELPISTLNIDKSFVLNSLSDKRSLAAIKGIILLGHSLGLHVAAEGVESYEISELLRREHCDFLQGFYYSKPLNMADLTQFLSGCKKPTLFGESLQTS